MVGLFGGATAVGAQEGGTGEFGVGLYLGNCDSLVEGAALFDLGDAELENEAFGNADENEADADEGENLEDQLDDESGGDDTDVEAAIGDDAEEAIENSDAEVVVQGDAPAVYVSGSTAFGASLVDLVDAPFAVAIRTDASDDTTADDAEDGADFVACGEFGGAVAGNEIVIPIEPIGDDGFSGVAILAQGEEDGESLGTVYLFGGSVNAESEEEDEEAVEEEDEESEEEESDDSDDDATPAAEEEGDSPVFIIETPTT